MKAKRSLNFRVDGEPCTKDFHWPLSHIFKKRLRHVVGRFRPSLQQRRTPPLPDKLRNAIAAAKRHTSVSAYSRP